MHILIAAAAAVLLAGSGQAQTPANTTDSALPADCAPPPSFAKRFPALTLEKALKKVSSRIVHESPSVVQANNRVTGAFVSSEDLYAGSVLGGARYDNRHTYAFIGQGLEGPRNYSIRVSNTNYSHGSKNTATNDIAEIAVRIGGRTVPLAMSGENEIGYCSSGPNTPCFSTAAGIFAVDRALFEELANADPAAPILATAVLKTGETAACPLYLSPLSFKAALLSIDEAHAKAAAKRAKQHAKGF